MRNKNLLIFAMFLSVTAVSQNIRITNKNIETEITIYGSREAVWEAFSNTKDYPKWNPFIISLEGEFTEKEKLKVTLQTDSTKKGMTFRPRVIYYKEQEQFVWKGHLLIPGLFDGQHYFMIKQISDNEVVFVQGEYFSGVFSRLMLNKYGSDTKQGFEDMNVALKNLVEKR